ncbi:NfeD family protein, partial [Aldersonia kunmingensis]
MAPFVWLVGGILLAAAEALSGDLFLIMLAGGAL